MKLINFTNNKLFYLILFFLIIFASFLRIYNINFDDLWTDEMFSFWISDPSIDFNETLMRAFSSGLNFFFDLSLKFFHFLFGYDVYVSRYFPVILSIISLNLFALLLIRITNKKSVILGFFILSINLYHIKYSQELRSYILTFLFTIIFLFLNFNRKNSIEVFKPFHLITSVIVIFLMYCNHAFTLLVVGSFIIFKIFKIIQKRKIDKNDIIVISSYILTSILFLIFYYYTNLKFIDPESLNGISPHWMKQPKLSFYTNYFFSEFFGSRILGLIHLLILIFCIVRFRKEIFIKNNDIYTYFVFLLIFSYIVPLIVGYLFGPILLGRFLIFLLIPIICLLCHFIFLIEKRHIRYLFIISICLTTSINHVLYENTFRFYSEPFHTKPQVKQSLEIINISETNTFTIKMSEKNVNYINDVYENYITKYVEKKKLQIDYFNNQNENIEYDKTWILYFKDITNEKFKVPKIFNKYKIVKTVPLNRLDLILLEKYKK